MATSGRQSLLDSEPAPKPIVPLPRGLPVEMISEYLEGCHKDLTRLHAALVADDYELARRVGHQMKGTGDPYGFPELTRIGSSIQQAAASRETQGLERQIELLDTYLRSVEIFPPGEVR